MKIGTILQCIDNKDSCLVLSIGQKYIVEEIDERVIDFVRVKNNNGFLTWIHVKYFKIIDSN
jgi:uncharacterized protein YlzI (FlbEa/FlbD family)